jgi:hypothetical protein
MPVSSFGKVLVWVGPLEWGLAGTSRGAWCESWVRCWVLRERAGWGFAPDGAFSLVPGSVSRTAPGVGVGGARGVWRLLFENCTVDASIFEFLWLSF